MSPIKKTYIIHKTMAMRHTKNVSMFYVSKYLIAQEKKSSEDRSDYSLKSITCHMDKAVG